MDARLLKMFRGSTPFPGKEAALAGQLPIRYSTTRSGVSELLL
jgi:hypothetical protein